MEQERFIPGTSRITEVESFHRYWAAAELCSGKKVLDAASGEGYGSRILASAAKETVGVDLCREAVEEAKKKYDCANLSFVCANVYDMPFGDGEFDCVVSFETVEHLKEPERLFAEIRRVLKPSGFVILSSPNKSAFDRRNRCENGENVFHVCEMECETLVGLMKRFFPKVAVYAQDSFFNSRIGDGDAMHYFVRKDDRIIRQEALVRPQYSIVLGGCGDLPSLAPSSYIDANFDEHFGYQPDDEAVVNQFGLRGELEREKSACAQVRNCLNDARQALGAAQNELVSTRETLKKMTAELEERNSLLTEQKAALERNKKELEEKNSLLTEQKAALEKSLNEERAKSEYLWTEYQELKKAWSLRIFGRFNLRKRTYQALQAAGRTIHRWGKSLLNRLDVRYETRINLKNKLYRHFGFCLKSVRGYNDWLLFNKRSFNESLSADTGLEVPEDLPLTSIVIPVYDNLQYTLSCLHSLYGIESKAPFEVIVADDCSKEDYAALLRREFPQVKVIRNQRNCGFLLTANRGAQEASGEYILFLNNDTEVLPGWLDELATALYHHPEAGMIGSQLVHIRTGALQESGNLICKNGEMIPLGRGADPNHPEFSYFREVDFVSGASIILRKRVFEEMKGFDPCYAPAYFEDPDLGLRLKRAGYRNFVMPLSRVMHWEMASYGEALAKDCGRNKRLFLDRWKEYLSSHALYDSPKDFAAGKKYPRERILYIDAEYPKPDRGSGGMDAVFFMNYFLKRGFDVVFHGEYTPWEVPKYTKMLLRMGVECVYQPCRRIWEYLETDGKSFSWLFISRIYQAQCFDRLLKKFCPQAHYIFNTVDLHFVREELEAELHDDPQMRKQAERTKRFELAVAKNANAVIVISRDEKKLLETEYGLTNVWHIPQARSIAGRRQDTQRKGAVFIGSAHPPNMDALRYFHDSILPLLPADFQLTVVGEALRDMMKELPEYRDLLDCRQFHFAGFVQDLADVMDTALISVAPLRYGAGTKGKVASSMSYGVPCV
ncbi:MAG: methyltransferase domain-containing protein, partial [Lentisphaeria bacterium]|nr:methyltransferase domain-containing protein [Lentisphaeria bacterium]